MSKELIKETEREKVEFIKKFKAVMHESRHGINREESHSEHINKNDKGSLLLTSPLRSSAALFGHAPAPIEPVASSVSVIPPHEICRKESPELSLDDRNIKHQKPFDKRLLPSVHKPN